MQAYICNHRVVNRHTIIPLCNVRLPENQCTAVGILHAMNPRVLSNPSNSTDDHQPPHKRNLSNHSHHLALLDIDTSWDCSREKARGRLRPYLLVVVLGFQKIQVYRCVHSCPFQCRYTLEELACRRTQTTRTRRNQCSTMIYSNTEHKSNGV